MRVKEISIYQIVLSLILIAVSLIFLIPVLSVFSTSLISQKEFLQRGSFILFPHHLNFTAYSYLLKDHRLIVNAYAVTLFRVIVGTFLNMFFTCTLAYGISKRNLPGRTAIVFFVFITMVFNGGMIPNYLLVKKLHLLNTVWAMIVPSLISAWNLFIMRNFFLTIPEELEEAALIDGANPPYILWKIMLPLSLPAIATISLFYAVYHWNEWFQATIYINNPQILPMQVILRNILQSGIITDQSTTIVDELPPEATLKSAVIVVSTLPILFVYPFIQKFFIKGTLVGSVKG